MSVILREGTYGKYYGSPKGSSSALTYDQMEVNAEYIYHYLIDKGWTINAIAGILGNMQVESSLNPGRWENNDVGNTSLGYGLVQWTPSTNYTNWVGLGDPSFMDNNLGRIIYELENGLQWFGVGDFAGMSFREFSKSMMSPYELGRAFILCYERPADQSAEAQSYRGNLALSWYDFLISLSPLDPSVRKNKKYKFILFKRRKFIYGQR